MNRGMHKHEKASTKHLSLVYRLYCLRKTCAVQHRCDCLAWFKV